MRVLEHNEDSIFMIIQKGKGTIICNDLGKPSDYDMDLSSATKAELIWWIKCLEHNRFVEP